MALTFSEDTRRAIEEMRAEFPDAGSLLIPTLQLAQDEFGHLSHEALKYVADELDLPVSVVAGVATFYHNLFTTERGRHVINICRTLPCALAGSGEVASRFEEVLGISMGETTPDGAITLRWVECLACCGTAPAVQIDFRYYESFSPDQIEEVVMALREDRIPPGYTEMPGGEL